MFGSDSGAQFAGLFQFADGTGIRRVPIHIDDSRPDPLAGRQGEPRKSFAAVRSRLGDSMKSMVSPAESTVR
jgi:hypothetical protein